LINLVAIFGILMGLAVEARRLQRRRERFLALAEGHASRRYDYGVGRYDLCFGDEYYERRALKHDFLKYLDVLRDHYADLEQKYRYAAFHPWVHVERDPPEPDYYPGGKEDIRNSS